VILVAVLNLAYFGVEFAVAAANGSVSLFAEVVARGLPEFVQPLRGVFLPLPAIKLRRLEDLRMP
jgi:hypothetical protein